MFECYLSAMYSIIKVNFRFQAYFIFGVSAAEIKKIQKKKKRV